MTNSSGKLKVFNFYEIQIIYFLFHLLHVFWVSCIRNHCLFQSHVPVCLYFPLRILALVLTMKCLISLELNFIILWYRLTSHFIPLHVDLELSQHNFWKDYCSQMNFLGTLLEINWPQMYRLISVLLILSHWSILLSLCHYFTVFITIQFYQAWNGEIGVFQLCTF